MSALLPSSYQRLASALDQFSGVGPKAASRMAQQLLLQPDFLSTLEAALTQAASLALCPNCRVWVSAEAESQAAACACCSNPQRHQQSLLIVLDEVSAETAFTSGYNGQIWLLHQLLSPIDRIGPDAIDCSGLLRRVQFLKSEYAALAVFIALPDSVEGRATALFLQRLIEKQQITVVQPDDLHTWAGLGIDSEESK